MRMTMALELRAVRKRFVAGIGACCAIANVLRHVDLQVQPGEAVVVSGPVGSGKSTLLLIAAGLLRADDGEVRWFGELAGSVETRRALYHYSTTRLPRMTALDCPRVHLIDLARNFGLAADEWIRERCDSGDAVVVGASDVALARRLGARAFTLHQGELAPANAVRARVAERARG
jgi:ABC-type ATPase involved in cell division